MTIKKVYGSVLIGVGIIMLFVPVIPGWALIGVGIALGFPTVWQRVRERFNELRLRYKKNTPGKVSRRTT